MKFTRKALSQTKVGELLENKRQLSVFDEIKHRKKQIAQGYQHGWIVIDGDRPLFVRSTWERNLVFYFEYLKKQGLIKAWYYEHKTYWFDGIKRGTNNYKPDFTLIENDDSETVIEVKAYFTNKDKIKLQRMAKYHPHVRIKVLSDDAGFRSMHTRYPTLPFEKYTSYDMIKEKKYLIKGWDQPFKKKEDIQHLIPLPMKRPKAKKKNSNILFDKTSDF
jgi:hypothetical protein